MRVKRGMEVWGEEGRERGGDREWGDGGVEGGWDGKGEGRVEGVGKEGGGCWGARWWLVRLEWSRGGGSGC